MFNGSDAYYFLWLVRVGVAANFTNDATNRASKIFLPQKNRFDVSTRVFWQQNNWQFGDFGMQNFALEVLSFREGPHWGGWTSYQGKNMRRFMKFKVDMKILNCNSVLDQIIDDCSGSNFNFVLQWQITLATVTKFFCEWLSQRVAIIKLVLQNWWNRLNKSIPFIAPVLYPTPTHINPC